MYAFLRLTKHQAIAIGRWADEHGSVQIEVTETPQCLFLYYGHQHKKCVQINRIGNPRPVPTP